MLSLILCETGVDGRWRDVEEVLAVPALSKQVGKLDVKIAQAFGIDARYMLVSIYTYVGLCVDGGSLMMCRH